MKKNQEDKKYQLKHFVKGILNQYIKYASPEVVSISDSGKLCLFKAPTGLGKTYNLVELAKRYIESNIKKNFIYVTTLKSNVDDFYRELQGSLFLEEERNCVHKMRSQVDTICDAIDGSSKSGVTLKKYRKIIHKSDLKKYDQAVKSVQVHKMKRDTEDFGKRASHLYKIMYKNAQNLFNTDLEKYKENKKLISSVFPESNMFNQQDDLLGTSKNHVFAMTTTKFVSKMYPVGRKEDIKGEVFNKKVLKNSVIFFDEFDSQNKTLLTSFLKNDLDVEDQLSVLKHIWCGLNHYMPQEERFREASLILEKFKIKLNDAFDEFKFNAHLVVEKKEEEDSQNNTLIFSRSFDSYGTLSYRPKAKYIRFESSSNQNVITEKGNDSMIKIEVFAEEVTRLIRSFKSHFDACVRKMIEQGTANESDASFNLLCALNMKSYSKYILQKSMQAKLRISNHDENMDWTSYHMTGFENVAVWKSAEDYQAEIKHSQLDITPTGFIGSCVLQGANIFGISATVDSKTIINNFDLDFLRSSLGERFIDQPEEDKEEIFKEYTERRLYKENNVKINVLSRCLDSEELSFDDIERNDGVDFYQKYIKNKGYYTHTDLVRKITPCKDTDPYFHTSRLENIFSSIEHFIKSEQRYMVLMLNAKIGGSSDFQDVCRGMEEVHEDLHIFDQMDSANINNKLFDKKVKPILESPCKKKKVIIFTTYQSAGVGASFTYGINSAIEDQFIYVDKPEMKHKGSSKTDIDYMYLECPSNMAKFSAYSEHSDSQTQQDDAAIATHNILSMKEANLITCRKSRSLINQIHDKSNNFSYKSFSDFDLSIQRVVEQAVGRCCRTQNKRKNIFIVLDSHIHKDKGLIPSLAKDNSSSNKMSHEYKAVVEFSKNLFNFIPDSYRKEEEKRINEKEKRFEHHSKNFERILGAAYNNPNKKTVDSYNLVRDEILKKPRRKSIDKVSRMLKNPYIEHEGENYFYVAHSDGGHSYHSNHPVMYSRCVSESSSRLDVLMKNEAIKNYFEHKGYATSFPAGQYHLYPRYFDMYMGALGEEAFKALVDSLDPSLGFCAHEMPINLFERFDCVLTVDDDKDNAYLVDIKNWLPCKDDAERDRNAIRKKVRNMREINLELSNSNSTHKNNLLQGRKLKIVFINTLVGSDGSDVILRKLVSSEGCTLKEVNKIEESDFISVRGFLNDDGTPSSAFVSFFDMIKKDKK